MLRESIARGFGLPSACCIINRRLGIPRPYRRHDSNYSLETLQRVQRDSKRLEGKPRVCMVRSKLIVNKHRKPAMVSTLEYETMETMP